MVVAPSISDPRSHVSAGEKTAQEVPCSVAAMRALSAAILVLLESASALESPTLPAPPYGAASNGGWFGKEIRTKP